MGLMLGIGIIGHGYWGPNLVRNFMESGSSRVVAVCDLRPERLAQLKARYPAIETTSDSRDLIRNPAIDAIAVVTPVSSHFDLALAALRAGKHVLVEKPLAQTTDQGRRLIEEAERARRVLMVDHTFVYTSAVRAIREVVASGDLGELYYYDSVRVNLGLFQHDVNVLWDLAVHDLSIMDFVLPARACAVSATGMSHVPGQPENIAFLTLFFENRLIAHMHVNWLAPVKVRRTLIGGSQKMIVYDDLEPSEKVKIYDKGITFNSNPENVYEMLIGYRLGDMWAPQLDLTEALRTEALHFIHCIENSSPPDTGGAEGLRVVQILEAAMQSLAERGRPVQWGE
ncbi:MAG TPA: Gfo/Idh/MocA family oxidoreductase [Acidobacteriota bacterium]|nr:Gfo/Idh/MocA family oxidoreductase [Acidobacteriota bacterium]